MALDNLTGQILGQYELRDLLGAGGMGAVYRAYQASLKREVAVKVLPSTLAAQPGYADRFNREAETAASLEHAHIVPIYDYGIQRGTSYIVMRWMTGGTLAQRLLIQSSEQKKTPSLGEISELLMQLASALDYAHSRDVVHRDIKPANIMFDNQGNAYLADFGIAKLLNLTNSMTATGAAMGTPSYMAPEQWRADSVVPATDQYALGVMTYMLVTGKLPFEASTPYALMHKHLNEQPTPPESWRPELPDTLGIVIERAIAKEPADRFPTVTAFAQAFSGATQGKTGEATNIFRFPLRGKPGSAASATPSRNTPPGTTRILGTPLPTSTVLRTAPAAIRNGIAKRPGMVALLIAVVLLFLLSTALIVSRQPVMVILPTIPQPAVAQAATLTSTSILTTTSIPASITPITLVGISGTPVPANVVTGLPAVVLAATESATSTALPPTQVPTTIAPTNTATLKPSDTDTLTPSLLPTLIPSATTVPTDVPTATRVPPTLTSTPVLPSLTSTPISPSPTLTLTPSLTPTPIPTLIPTLVAVGAVCDNFAPSRLTTGMQARILRSDYDTDTSKPIRTGPAAGTITAQLPFGVVVQVLAGPSCSLYQGKGIAWWKVSYAGIVGWTSEGWGNLYFLEPIDPNTGLSPAMTATPAPLIVPSNTRVPTLAATHIQCDGTPPSQLAIGMQAQIGEGLPNRLRSVPGLNNSVVIDTMPGGTVITILDGPVCKDRLLWWHVSFGGKLGWTAEGSGSDYWIVPFNTNGGTPTPTCYAGGRFLQTWDAYQTSLGCPVGNESITLGTSQAFDGGLLVWRQDTRQVYLILPDGRWNVYVEHWAEGAVLNCAGPYIQRGLGEVYCDHPEVQADLGNAKGYERPGTQMIIQPFDTGLILMISPLGTQALINSSQIAPGS